MQTRLINDSQYKYFFSIFESRSASELDSLLERAMTEKDEIWWNVVATGLEGY